MTDAGYFNSDDPDESLWDVIARAEIVDLTLEGDDDE